MNWFLRPAAARWLMALSLLLNLLLGGAVLGHWLHPRRPTPMAGAAMQALPEASRQALETRLRDLRRDFDSERAAMRLARDHALALLEAEPFDAAAYRAQLQESMNLRGERQRQRVDDLVALAESLNPKERAALAEALRHPPRRHGPKH